MKRADLEAEIRRLHDASFGWALTCCDRSAEDAEDVLQMAYVKVLQRYARFDGRSSFRTWLFGVIRNTARERRRRDLRRERRRRPLPDPDRIASRETGAQTALERAETADRLVDALDALADRQREVLHLVFYQDLTIVEAARVMGVSVGSARTHYERGKKRLRTLLAETAIQ